MRHLLFPLFFTLLVLPLFGQNLVQNHSFEDVNSSNPSSILFSEGDVAEWSTAVLSSLGVAGNDVQELLTCQINGSNQNITASDQQYFARLFPETLIRNNLNGKVFPGQKLTVSIDHRKTICSGAIQNSYVNVHDSGSDDNDFFGNEILASFFSSDFNNWVTLTEVTTLPVYSSSPCFFDQADIRLSDESLNSEQISEKTLLTDTDYNLYDNLSITDCEVATDDLLFYDIGILENCAKVSFTLQCDLTDKKWYYWEFGDGTTLCGANEPTPMHSYLSPGTYTVHLTTVNGEGCLEKITEEINILCDDCEGLTVDFDFECQQCTPITGIYFDEVTGQWTFEIIGYNCKIAYTDNSLVTVPGESIVGWTWTLNGVEFSSDQNSSHSLSGPNIGSTAYEICLSVIDSRGCVDQFCEDISIPCRLRVKGDGLVQNPQAEKALKQASNIDLKVFPNPTTDQINVNLTSDQQLGQWTLQLFDLNGRSLRTLQNNINYDQFNTILNLEDLPRGTYLLQLQTDQGVQYEKIVLY